MGGRTIRALCYIGDTQSKKKPCYRGKNGNGKGKNAFEVLRVMGLNDNEVKNKVLNFHK